VHDETRCYKWRMGGARVTGFQSVRQRPLGCDIFARGAVVRCDVVGVYVPGTSSSGEQLRSTDVEARVNVSTITHATLKCNVCSKCMLQNKGTLHQQHSLIPSPNSLIPSLVYGIVSNSQKYRFKHSLWYRFNTTCMFQTQSSSLIKAQWSSPTQAKVRAKDRTEIAPGRTTKISIPLGHARKVKDSGALQPKQRREPKTEPKSLQEGPPNQHSAGLRTWTSGRPQPPQVAHGSAGSAGCCCID
jgi:hypothetical protein